MKIREINREEIGEVRKLNRQEIINQVYRYQNGTLVIEDRDFEINGWNLEELEHTLKELHDLYDRGGLLIGAFINHKLIGIIALDCKFIGRRNDQLQMVFLHIDHNYRDKGLGTHLMNMVIKKAKNMDAKILYISATPSKHTVDFYMGLGCKLASEINPELSQLEPEDIHLELLI